MIIDRENLLQVRRLSKLYSRVDSSSRKRMANDFLRTFLFQAPRVPEHLYKGEFWSLKNVSFSLCRGQAIGVIGFNGAGKTTLLRILAGQILPDKGEVKIRGNTAAMIDLTAGFNVNASGRQNIFFRGATLGRSHQEMVGSVNEIVEFSELGDAIDAPFSTYSSGMKMRLAFSILMASEPDLLFIDEVLSVGDFRFRQKCLAKVREMRDRSAFVFVSHSMGDIERFCDEVIVMHKGQMHFVGPPREAIEIYEELEGTTVARDASKDPKAVMGPTFSNDEIIRDVETYWCNEDGAHIHELNFRETIRLMVRFESTTDIRNLIIGVPIWNENAEYTTGVSTQITLDDIKAAAGEKLQFQAEIEGGFINPGTIQSMITILDGPEFLYRQPNPDLRIKSAPHPTWGAVTLRHQWHRL